MELRVNFHGRDSTHLIFKSLAFFMGVAETERIEAGRDTPTARRPGPMCKPGANLANPNSAPKNATPLLLAKI